VGEEDTEGLETAGMIDSVLTGEEKKRQILETGERKRKKETKKRNVDWKFYTKRTNSTLKCNEIFKTDVTQILAICLQAFKAKKLYELFSG
jgi:hypothetical protein